MSTAYKFANPDGVYFTSTATVQWVDVFTRPVYADIIIESLKYCQVEKDLVIHAWCLMSNHLHLIISRRGNDPLEAILRDFKKFTSGTITKAIQEEPTESRRDWMIWIFKQAGKNNPNNRNFQFWQQDNHPEELITNKFIDQKLDYIHNNPVLAGLIEEPEHYRYSSAKDYAGDKGLLDIMLIEYLCLALVCSNDTCVGERVPTTFRFL